MQALQSYTMKVGAILPEQGFCRISRFVIVNYAYVEDIQKTSLIMEDSMRFNIYQTERGEEVMTGIYCMRGKHEKESL